MTKFELDSDQKKKYQKWLKRHDKTCVQKDTTAMGGRLTYRFTPTGLGTITQVHCICGRKVDLTPDNW